MLVTKFGHCCLLLEIDGVRVLIDPGAYSTGQDDVRDIDAILITHEHTDHYHADSVKKVVANNPTAVIIANNTVGALLDKEGVAHTRVTDGESTQVRGVKIEGCGREHALIYGQMGACENTGFRVGEKFYYGGDSFFVPGISVDVLALPVDAPWMKVAEAVEFAKTVRPRAAFPVHDAMQTEDTNAFYDQMFSRFLEAEKIEFVSLKSGDSHEF
ncbi:MAG TPA: MBL fold metallo-hydrolase [Candidatus Paceibacterota bacterium]|nr:MBL fold metallo-hydrolase [Candidatus Paceibacterota bacterium]